MVTKKLRTEYMKRFKDPKWETYSKCYEDLLKYRLTRRLLEQTHNPWFWNEWDGDSESSGSSSPPNKNKIEPLILKDVSPPGCGGKTPEHRETPPTEPSEQIIPNEEQGPEIAEVISPPPIEVQDAVNGGTRETEEEAQEQGKGSTKSILQLGKEKDLAAAAVQTKTRHSRKPLPRLKGPLRRSKETTKEDRHPFALYGWGEKQADMASKKTHNVCPAASTREIHVSALRAKTRREVERQLPRVVKPRARSADLDKTSIAKLVPEFDPWVTEYMRSFSAR